MPGTVVNNPSEWMINNPNRWIVTYPNVYRNLIQQEEFTDEEALDYMRETREEGDRHMPITAFDDVVEYIDNQGAIHNITAGDITTNTMDINNTVNTAFWTRQSPEMIIHDEQLRKRVEQLGSQVKLLSDLVGEMKEFIIQMGFDKLLEGESDGKKTDNSQR